jgi:hypothetical protein
MSTFILGDTVIVPTVMMDAADALLSGVTYPAGVTLYLDRQSGTTMVAASETLTWTEIGVTGRYTISFTPQNLGVYSLRQREIDASSSGRWYSFELIDVLAAGSTFSPVYTNAFCAETDIERRLNQTISATTSPSATAAAAFAEMRAAILQSICAKAGYPVTPTTITSGSRLEDMLRDANSIGAALDYSLAQQLGVSPSKTDRVAEFAVLWENYCRLDPKNPGLLVMECKNNASLSTDHILSGDTLANPTETAGTTYAEPIGIGMGSLF